MKETLFIGIDDTDSLKGSCTTYIASVITTQIFDQVTFLDFPNLIRLNPNIPYKTRGNGAVALRINGEKSDLETTRDIVIKTVKKYAHIGEENTNPGIAFLKKDIPSSVKDFSQRAMWDVISIPEAEQFEKLKELEFVKFGNGRGIIGALSAIGNTLSKDYTFEHLSYRQPKNYGTKRKIDSKSVFFADNETPLTFNNIDYEYNKIMITPRGADPVFAGIRGEKIEEVLKFWSLIKPLEKISLKMIFRTNQHTNHHLIKEFKINQISPHLAVIIKGNISKNPYYIKGSHLIFSIADETGEIDCAAYEPAKRFRSDLSNLRIGDKIVLFGGVRPEEENHPITINTERIKVETLAEIYQNENPFCDNCRARLKSAGKNKGFKCFKCGAIFREKKSSKKKIHRKIMEKEYLPPIIAQRHLTKPFSRDNRDNTNQKINQSEMVNILRELIKYNKENF